MQVDKNVEPLSPFLILIYKIEYYIVLPPTQQVRSPRSCELPARHLAKFHAPLIQIMDSLDFAPSMEVFDPSPKRGAHRNSEHTAIQDEQLLFTSCVSWCFEDLALIFFVVISHKVFEYVSLCSTSSFSTSRRLTITAHHGFLWEKTAATFREGKHG